MTTAQIIAALDEEIDRLKQVRSILARASTPTIPLPASSPKHKIRQRAKDSRRSEGQRRRWAKIREQAAAPAAPQVEVKRVRPHREPRRYGVRPRKREQTALTASIPDGPVVANRPGGAPFVHRPFAELEALLQQAS